METINKDIKFINDHASITLSAETKASSIELVLMQSISTGVFEEDLFLTISYNNGDEECMDGDWLVTELLPYLNGGDYSSIAKRDQVDLSIDNNSMTVMEMLDHPEDKEAVRQLLEQAQKIMGKQKTPETNLKFPRTRAKQFDNERQLDGWLEEHFFYIDQDSIRISAYNINSVYKLAVSFKQMGEFPK